MIGSSGSGFDLSIGKTSNKPGYQIVTGPSVIGLTILAAAAHAQTDLPFNVMVVTSFDEPRALAFLPDGRMLATEKKGNLFIVTQDGESPGFSRTTRKPAPGRCPN